MNKVLNMKNQIITAIDGRAYVQEGISQSLKMPKVREVPLMTKAEHLFRQGDLYLTIGGIAHKGSARSSLQLVPGNTTGSRHCVVDSPHVRIYESLAKPVTITLGRDTKIARFPGPLIIADEIWAISHPKHGWMSKIKNLIVQSWQQCDYLRQRQAKD